MDPWQESSSVATNAPALLNITSWVSSRSWPLSMLAGRLLLAVSMSRYRDRSARTARSRWKRYQLYPTDGTEAGVTVEPGVTTVPTLLEVGGAGGSSVRLSVIVTCASTTPGP